MAPLISEELATVDFVVIGLYFLFVLLVGLGVSWQWFSLAYLVHPCWSSGRLDFDSAICVLVACCCGRLKTIAILGLLVKFQTNQNCKLVDILLFLIDKTDFMNFYLKSNVRTRGVGIGFKHSSHAKHTGRAPLSLIAWWDRHPSIHSIGRGGPNIDWFNPGFIGYQTQLKLV